MNAKDKNTAAGQYTLRLPDVGEGTTESEIVKWHVKVGDRVEEDAPLVDISTDKAVVEIPSPVTGIVKAVFGKEGDALAVGSDLALFELDAGEQAPAESAPKAAPPRETKTAAAPPQPTARPPATTAKSAAPATAAKAAAPATAAPVLRSVSAGRSEKEAAAMASAVQSAAKLATEQAPGSPTESEATGAQTKPLASPSVRHHARTLGLQLADVAGTGKGGRITHADLEAHASGQSHSSAVPLAASAGLVEEHRVIGVRRKIAEHMTESKRHIPHFGYVEEADMTALESLRAHLNAKYKDQRPRLTLLPFVIRALVRAAAAHPEINARYDDDKGVVYRHREVHVGIAAQTPSGLMVPVLRNAEARDLWDCAAEIARLSDAAKSGGALRSELSGSTITLTSLGPLGGVSFTPIINYPEVAIVGVNRMIEKPVVVNGQVVVRTMMGISSAFDHRVVDGWNAAAFIQDVKQFLEQPATMFMDEAS